MPSARQSNATATAEQAEGDAREVVRYVQATMSLEGQGLVGEWELNVLHRKAVHQLLRNGLRFNAIASTSIHRDSVTKNTTDL